MGKKNMGMMDWFKGSDALNLVMVGRHIKQDEEGNDIYVCDSCGTEFSSSSDLLDHMPSHDAEIQEVMNESAPMITEEYSPEITQDWSQTNIDSVVPEQLESDLQGAVENYGEQQQIADVNLAEEIPNQTDSLEVDSAPVETMIDIAKAEENSPEQVYETYQDLVPTDNAILPSSSDVSDVQVVPNPSYDVMGNPIDEMGNSLDYESGYTTEGGNQEFPGKQPIGDSFSGEEEKPKEKLKEVLSYKIRFSDGEKVFYDGVIYGVVMPPGALEEAQKTGVVQLAIYGEGGQAVDYTSLKDEVLTPQRDVEVSIWDNAWTAQTGIGKEVETQTEEETKPEESGGGEPPDNTEVASFSFGYFQANTVDGTFISDAKTTGKVVDGMDFVVSWKININNGLVKLLYPDGSETEVENESNTAVQIMNGKSMQYFLIVTDYAGKELGRQTLIVGWEQSVAINNRPSGAKCINSFSVNNGGDSTPTSAVTDDNYPVSFDINSFDDVIYRLDCNGKGEEVKVSASLPYKAGTNGATKEIWTLSAFTKTGSAIEKEQREVIVQKSSLFSYSFNTPSVINEGSTYKVEWKVTDDPSSPLSSIRFYIDNVEMNIASNVRSLFLDREKMGNVPKSYRLVIEGPNPVDEEKIVQCVPTVLGTYSVELRVDPDQAKEGDPYTVTWSVVDDDSTKPIVNILRVDLRENNISIDQNRRNFIMPPGTDNKVYTLMVDEGNGNWIEKKKVTLDRVHPVGGMFVTTLTISVTMAKESDSYTIDWSVVGSAGSNPESRLVVIPEGKQRRPLSTALNGPFTDTMETQNRTYKLYVRESGSGSWILKEEQSVIWDDPSNPNSGNNNIYIDRFDAPREVTDGDSYTVAWAVSNPDITRVRFLINGNERFTDRSKTVDQIMGAHDRVYVLEVYDSNNVLKDSPLRKVKSLPSNVNPSNLADNNPHDWIVYFEVGNLSKNRGESFSADWSVVDGRNRSVRLLVNGQNQPGSFPLTGHHDLVMRDRTLNIRLEVLENPGSRVIANLTRVVTLNSGAARTVKERLLAGESEETLMSSTPSISEYAINAAKAEIEAERRNRTTNTNSAGLIKAEMELEEMRKKHGAGNFWGQILQKQMENVSKENIANSQYVRSGEAKAREEARANIDKNTATIIASDNTLKSALAKEENTLKALLAKEETARMKIEADATAKAGKSGLIGAAGKDGKPRNPITDSEGLGSFVGSLTAQGDREQESGIVHNPLNMDMGGIMPRRLGEEEVDATYDRYKNNSFAWSGMDSLRTVVPQGGQTNQTIGSIGMTGLTFGGIPGMTTSSSGILNPSSLNAATMNRTQSMNTVPISSVAQNAGPAFAPVSSSEISQMQNVAMDVDPLKGKSVEELKSMGLTKKYVDRTTGHRMPEDPKTKIFTSDTGAKYYYDRGVRGVGAPVKNRTVVPSSAIDSIINKGVGQVLTTTVSSSSASVPLDDFAFGQEDIYGKNEKENIILNGEYGKPMEEFYEDKDNFSAGVNIIDPSKVRSSGSVDIASMLSRKI